MSTYIAAFPAPAQTILAELRELSLSHAPLAVEALKWNQPAYSMRTILFTFSGHKHHANMVFTPSTRQAFAKDLANFETGKGSIKLPYGERLPRTLLAQMINFRITECEEQHVNWM